MQILHCLFNEVKSCRSSSRCPSIFLFKMLKNETLIKENNRVVMFFLYSQVLDFNFLVIFLVLLPLLEFVLI